LKEKLLCKKSIRRQILKAGKKFICGENALKIFVGR